MNLHGTINHIALAVSDLEGANLLDKLEQKEYINLTKVRSGRCFECLRKGQLPRYQ